MRVARSSWFAISSSYQRLRTTARSLAVSAAHAGKARAAASVARRVSATPRLGTVPRVSPLAGLRTACVAPLAASTHSPPIRQRVRSRSGSRSFMPGALLCLLILVRLHRSAATQAARAELERAAARQRRGLRVVAAALVAVEAVARAFVHVHGRLRVGGADRVHVAERDALVHGAVVVHDRAARLLRQ